jgi:hypothetical protein
MPKNKIRTIFIPEIEQFSTEKRNFGTMNTDAAFAGGVNATS